MKLSSDAVTIVQRIEYATIATVDDSGQPWNAPVYCAYDTGYNFYWGSHKDSQHAVNIRQNGHVFMVIYNSTIAPGQGMGVYLSASCIELSAAKDITAAHQLIEKRRAPVPYWKLEQFLNPDSPTRLYRATLENAWINGESQVNGTYIDTRVGARG